MVNKAITMVVVLEALGVLAMELLVLAVLALVARGALVVSVRGV